MIALPAVLRAATFAAMAAIAASQPAAADDMLQRDKLTGDWGGVRTELQNQGFDITLDYIAETMGAVSGGVEDGFVYQGRLQLSLDVDLDKLMSWEGAFFHVTGYQIQRTGGGIGARSGALSDPSSTEAHPSTRLFTLWLQQSLFDDALSIRAGQLAADDEFMISPTAANLLNSTFGFADVLALNLPNGGPEYPLATPGIRVQVNPTPELSLLAAVFSGDPAGDSCSGNPQLCNSYGTTFSFSGGSFWIGEAQYAINQGDQATGLPGVYKLGIWYQDASFADERFGTDAAGNKVSLASGTAVAPENHEGNGGIYGLVDQTLWRSDDKSQTLNGFLRLGASPADRNPISFYVDGGLGVTGLIPTRDQDKLTFGVAYAQISQDAAHLDKDTRRLDDPSFPVRDEEIVLEVNYLAQLTPAVTLQPDIQYIIHPGGSVPDPSDPNGGTIDDALVLGVRATLTF
ncbi:carbohydrate porin [Hypericibacter sp.]|uniref:carbohydrate porin n=1 Tax=Hypericibacter sp. TaxID=2705401 RepID=UPI003D6D7815